MDYYIDNYNFKGFGIYVQESTGVVDLPKFKPPTETDWAEYNGVIIDTEKTPRTEARTIQLKCFLKADNQIDFLTKISAFQAVFMTKGLKRLSIILTNEVGLFFDVYMSDGLQVTKRWSDSTMVGQFTVTLIEPEPIKKIIRFDSQGSASTLSFKTSEAVSIYWGDGSAQQDLYGNVSLSHTYDESGIYFAIIHGNIDNITDLTTSGDVLTTNNGGNIEIEIPEILNGALESVELFNVAEPGISQLTPYIRFAFNNNSETRYLRITIDANDEWLEQITIINNRLNAITADITSLQSNKADKTQITTLQQSITTNATNIANNTSAITAINNKIGEPNGIAELDTTGKVPQSQLPSFVDDVVEYASLSNFPATGESGKIYIAIDTNITYRWGGSTYVPIGSDLALGETASTAYRGDRGKVAYDHSQTQGNPHNTTIAQISGLQSALNGKQPTIGKNEYIKQVLNLDNYTTSQNGEIVEYIGVTNSKYTHGYIYERDTSKDIPAGSLIIHIDDEESYNYNEDGTEKTITIPKQDFITEDSSSFSFYYLTVTRRINSSYTHNGIINSILDLSQSAVSGLIILVSFESTLTGQILINLTYDNGEWKDENNYTYTINSSTKLTNPIYTLKGEINKRIIIGTSDYYWVEGFSFNGGFTTLIIDLTDNPTVETISEAIIFWQQTNVQPQKDTTEIESNIAALQTDKANEVTSFTEAATRANIASGDTVTTICGKIKKWFTDLKAVAFSGSYNDLTDKLQNATTTTAGLMSANDKLKLKSFDSLIYVPQQNYSSLTNEDAAKEIIAYIWQNYDHNNAIFEGTVNGRNLMFYRGCCYATDLNNLPAICNFLFTVAIGNGTTFKAGYANGTWYYAEI